MGPGVIMKRRIGLWVLAGFVVASFWVLLTFITRQPHYNLDRWAILSLTAPAAIFRNRPMTWYQFIFLNTAMYGVLGLAVEWVRRALRSTRHRAA